MENSLTTLSASPPLKWPGGKNAFNGKLAKWIISLMPPHLVYVEPYFGGGAVLLHKDPEGVSEVVNDIYSDLMNFWRVLAQTPDRMLRELWATPFSETAFDAAEQALADTDAVRRATAFFIRCRQSRQGLMKGFTTLSSTRTRGGMNEQVSAWLTAIEGLPEIHARLKRVVIFNKAALKVINDNDSVNTLFYLDPPYVTSTRVSKKAYVHEMTQDDHAALLAELMMIKGKFILSGYDNEMYENARSIGNWTKLETSIVNNASSKKTKDVKKECVWLNYTPPQP